MGLATATDGFKGYIRFLAFKQKPQRGNWGYGKGNTARNDYSQHLPSM